ncbi:MAG: isopeptide-forming domain-containing fimbrial protein [Coriobacteriales bacterium]|nr:isopeptide-forming domain-containing fimbrial protein [Coriobacteriales bacterium]
MSKKHTLAKAAITAGLTLAMSLGGALAPATVAFAGDTTPTAAASTITINNVQGNQTSFKGYEIFKADVADNGNGGKTVSNIAWANDTVAAKVTAAIKAQDSKYAGTTAQDAADWMTKNITGTDATTAVDSSSAANAIAKAVEGLTASTTVTGGKASSTLESGYWLFVTDPDSVDNKVGGVEGKKDTETYTAPIFTVIGGTTVTVTEKSSIPTVDKWVKNDKTGSDWGKVADSEAGQELNYKLVGTVAQDVATYDTYYYKFTDTLSAGLNADANSIVVKIQNGDTETEITSGFTKGVVSNNDATDAKDQTSTLSVEFNDLKAAAKKAGITLDANSKVNVYYNAKLDPTKAMKVASEDNPNEVKLTYSNNPHSNSHGETVPHKVTDYTYKLNIVKESSTEATKKLSGAKFTIKATTPDDSDSTNKYVQADGTLGDTAYEFTTNDQGEIAVSGLDAGTYTVSETKSPDGFNKVADFTFEITPTWNANNTALDHLSVTKTASYVDANANNNQVNLTVKDTPGSGLPLTGQAGVTFTWIAGGAVLAIGMAHLLRNRRQDDAE